MTRAALDSAYAPSDAQIAAAKAAGYVAWFGYFKFGNDGVLNGWANSDFQRVLAGGLGTAAYCSGWADPLQAKARAAALAIRIRLDVEGEIRGDGDWVQGWLNASGAGLYGNGPVFAGRQAADYILAGYPTFGDPGNESWPAWVARPNGPCGWQWVGSHNFAGITVDSSWLDDNFFAFGPGGGSGEDMATKQDIEDALNALGIGGGVTSIFNQLVTLNSNLTGLTQAIKDGQAAPVNLTPIITAIADLKAHPAVVADPVLASQVSALAKHLGVGTP